MCVCVCVCVCVFVCVCVCILIWDGNESIGNLHWKRNIVFSNEILICLRKGQISLKTCLVRRRQVQEYSIKMGSAPYYLNVFFREIL